MSTAHCVGILDWGVGGLDTYRQLKAANPATRFVYWSDTGVLPYGKMHAAALRSRVHHVTTRLVDLGAQRIVVACNAASTALPFIKLAAPTTGVIEHGIGSIPPGLTGKLGILGGARTIRSRLYQRALWRPELNVVARIAQPLSGHIEAGTTKTSECQAALDHILAPLADANALLLACTHYPALANELRQRAPRATLFDPVSGLVGWVKEHWRLGDGGAVDDFLTTGDPEAMQEAAARVWGLTLARCEQISA